jgi:outer membrane lipopolysaccharide assembly protein LptE/RlpB
MTVMRRLSLLLLLVYATASSACGYALAGRGSFLPDYIRVVGIPAFTNKSTAIDIDRALTDKVRVEFASRGRYTVRPDTTNVDAILTGTITSVRLDAVAFTQNSQASRMAIVVTAAMEFRDLRDNKVLWSNPAQTYREEYDVTTSLGGNDVSAFFGQNDNALERLAQNFARAVVTSVLEVF